MFGFVLPEKFENFPRFLFAHSIIFFLFVFSLINLSLPLTGQIRPFFILMAIFYWSMHRPNMIHPLLLFVYGIAFDLILNFPVGLHAILFLLVQWVIKTQRAFFMGQPYLVVWICFACTCFSVFAIEWIFFSVISSMLLNLTPVLSSFLLTVLMFPPVSLFFMLINKMLPLTPSSVH